METEKAIAQVLDVECQDSLAGDRNKSDFLKERQGLMSEEIKVTLKIT